MSVWRVNENEPHVEVRSRKSLRGRIIMSIKLGRSRSLQFFLVLYRIR